MGEYVAILYASANYMNTWVISLEVYYGKCDVLKEA